MFRRSLFSVLVLVLVSVAPAAELWPDSLLHAGLAELDIRPDEASLFPHVKNPDVFRLGWITEAMESPMELSQFLAGPLEKLELFDEADSRSDLRCLDALAPILFGQETAESDKNEILPPSPRRETDLPHRWFEKKMRDALPQRAATAADLRPAELSFLIRDGLRVLDEADTRDITDLFELRAMDDEFAARSDSIITLWSRLDRPALLESQVVFLREAAAYSYLLHELVYAAAGDPEMSGANFPDGSYVEGDLHYAKATALGNFVVGAAGRNRYEGDFAFILELGGDDEYRLRACRPQGESNFAADPGGWRFIHDLGGDDRYTGLEDAAVAGAFLGASGLIDESGDDIYEGKSFDLGGGWCGLGLLIDRAGNDIYTSDRVTQGAGGCGAGILRDEGGEDVYRAHLYAQGFGFVGGIGHLYDLSGPDSYLAVPHYLDMLRYEDHSVTLSQGFGFGRRPKWSGGLGILSDHDGNDNYVADIYGQGTSYWYAAGLLVDRAGNDHYGLWQYGQGAGVHLALAALVDESGNDSYACHGVGQGCGHDLAIGVLYDAAGNDRYSCDDMAQGAGNANGIGVLLDAAGSDGYLGKNANASGYGDRRRHFGSLGLCVDASGDDWRSEIVEPGTERGSFRGVKLDLDGPVAGPAWQLADPIPYEGGRRTWDEYFTMAAAGEPRFANWKKAGHDSLMAHPHAAIPVLIAHFNTDSARERRTLKDLMREYGDIAVDPLREVLREGVPSFWRLAAWSLESIRDARAYPELMAMLSDPRDARDQVSALAALSRLNGLTKAELKIFERYCEAHVESEDTSTLVLKEIAYCLDAQGLGSPRLLLGLAAHESYAVRWAAEEALAKRSGWGDDFARAWNESKKPEELARLAGLLRYRPTREVRKRIREAMKSDFADDTRLRAALRHALEDHPQKESKQLEGLLLKLGD